MGLNAKIEQYLHLTKTCTFRSVLHKVNCKKTMNVWLIMSHGSVGVYLSSNKVCLGIKIFHGSMANTVYTGHKTKAHSVTD